MYRIKNNHLPGQPRYAARIAILQMRHIGLRLLPTIFACLLASSIQAQESTQYGQGALQNNSSDTNRNSAFGFQALLNNTTGKYNAAGGYQALYDNLTGIANTAFGYKAQVANTNGAYNTAYGFEALLATTSGSSNTACGAQALYFNTSGYDNTASGCSALFENTTGYGNTACGFYAVVGNTTGVFNTGIGYQALYQNATGNDNTAVGYYALTNATGNRNTALGFGAGHNITSGNNNIMIGHLGTSTDSAIIRIGTPGVHSAAFLAGVNGVTVSSGAAVYIDANGQLGTLTSSRRFKTNIKAIGAISGKLMSLRPVQFRYNDAAEKGPHPVQYGLIAEEVAKVYPNLVQYDKQGKPFTVYYHLLTPMLLNELQKAHSQIGQIRAAHQAEAVAHRAEVASLRAALQRQSAELASLKRTQQQQSKMLAKLAASLQAEQSRMPGQQAEQVHR
jgi:hypothetical protein